MTYQEAKQAFSKRTPIIFNGITYKHINAIVFRKTEYIESIELELQDRQANSVTIAKLEEVKLT